MTQATQKAPPYFLYFPGNYRWSAAILSMLSSAPWGGADVSEVDKIGRMLKAREASDRRLPHVDRVLPSLRCALRREDRDRRSPVRGRQPARLFPACAEYLS